VKISVQSSDAQGIFDHPVYHKCDWQAEGKNEFSDAGTRVFFLGGGGKMWISSLYNITQETNTEIVG
jgi:hypothetical protein